MKSVIKLEKTEVVGWEAAIRGMRNPLNSWDKSDSEFWHDPTCGYAANCEKCEEQFNECSCQRIGKNDFDLMKRLRNAGTDHRKFMRMLTVYVDITAPLYWWKEFDTYKVGTVANSCSTMHKIHAKEFTIDDFSCEHLDDVYFTGDRNVVYYNGAHSATPFDVLAFIVDALNRYRKSYIETKDKQYWWMMIQLLPSSYNQKRTVMLNYEVLANMYKSRKNHKLDEWHDLCSWIEGLPYSELITRKDEENE